jgi:hypothetical protein
MPSLVAAHLARQGQERLPHMNNELMHRLEHFLAKEEHDTLRGKPALDEEIDAAEEKLNVKLHSDYKDFIKRFGGAHAGMNIHAFSNGSSLGKETVIELTLDARESYAGDERATELNKSYVISISGTGDPIIINPVGEVVVLYHDSDEREVLAASFEELLQKSFVEW